MQTRRRREGANMGYKKSYVWICCVCLIISGSCSKTDALDCLDIALTATATPGANVAASIQNVFGTFVVSTAVPETFKENDVAYSVEIITPDLEFASVREDSGENTANEYMDLVITDTKLKLDISVKKTMLNLPDYINDEPTTTLNSQLILEFKTGESCNMELEQNIVDENTQPPGMPKNQAFDIREDYPVGIQITSSLLILDKDGGPPNTLVEVVMDSSCPLVPIASPVDCEGGTEVPVLLELKSQLDYDSMQDSTITCTVTLTNSELTHDGTITINVQPIDDELPKFDNTFYSITLPSSTMNENNPLQVIPEDVKAVDQDKPATKITYSMNDVTGNNKWNKYFDINPDTAEITQIEDIPTSELSTGPAMFYITATDESSEKAYSLLEITLPEPETTTISSTSTESSSSTGMTCPTVTTCEPCLCTTTDIPTCPSTTTCEPCEYTTSDTPTCPTTTTCEPCECTTTDIPTCPSATTCEPCEYTTSDTPTCPTTTTCEPCVCSTDTSTCPTTTTCEPCECSTTDTSTCPTCEPCGPTDPPSPTVQFKYNAYAFKMFQDDTDKDVGVVQVKDNVADVIYKIDENEAMSPPDATNYFKIDEKSGEISSQNQPSEGQYSFYVKATADDDSDKSQINIIVINPSPGSEAELETPLFTVTVSESDDAGKAIATFKPSKTSSVILSYEKTVIPSSLTDSFTIDYNSDTQNGVLKLSKKLDADSDIKNVKITVTAHNDQIQEHNTKNNKDNEISRNQAVVDITIQDENDEAPKFADAKITVGYPELEALRRTMGSIIQLQATDKDTVGELHYFIGSNNDGFIIDSNTGELFADPDVVECDPQCSIKARATDNDNDDATVDIDVLSIKTVNIYTITLNGYKTTDEIAKKLEKLSEDTGYKISKLYSTFSTEETSSFRESAPSSDGIDVNAQVQIYALNGEEFVSLDDLNNKLEDIKAELTAEEFKDEKMFTNTNGSDEVLGYQIAIGVVSGILGLVLIAIVAVFGRKRYLQKKKAKPGNDSVPNKINSLGNIYHDNNGYTDDSDKEDEFTRPTDHMPLKRLNPGPSVEEITPPSFQSTNELQSQSSKPPYVANPSPSPILGPIPRAEYYPTKTKSYPYNDTSSNTQSDQDINKLADSADSNSSSTTKTNSGKSILRNSTSPTTFTNPPTEPKKDYATHTSSSNKFSNMKGSPPPKKKTTNNLTQDEGDQDSDSNVSSINGVLKKSNLKSDTSDSETDSEKRNVGFKILVDTYEIEAQNKGPAEKKAEKAKIEKIEEEDEEEEEATNM